MRHTQLATAFLVLSLWRVAASAQTPTFPAELDTLLAQRVTSVSWSISYDEWRLHHPEATCEQYHGSIYDQDPEDQWCYRCSAEIAGTRLEYFFFGLMNQEPLTCRLYKVQGATADLSDSLLRELHGKLERQLAQRLGPPSRPDKADGFCSFYWREVRRWETGPAELLFYLNYCQGRTHRLEVVARQRALLDAVAEEKRLERLREEEVARRQEDNIRRLAAEVHTLAPDLQEIVENSGHRQEGVRRLVLRLLEAAADAPETKRPALLLAADALAGALIFPDVALAETQHLRPAVEEEVEKWAARAVHFAWSPLGAVYVYQHDLLWRVWQEHGRTPWGEQAFVDLLESGWDTSGVCAEGDDAFRRVIEHGEAFLAERPESSQRSRVLNAVAQAYETWWSLSQASDRDDYANSAAVREGSEEARLKAIDYYEQVLAAAPESLMATFARRRLPHLRAQRDTSQRRFLCFYD